MIDKDLLFGDDENLVIKYPFKLECITGISIRFWKSRIDDSLNFTGEVEFKKDQTEATQKFKGNNLGDVYLKIQEFIEKL